MRARRKTACCLDSRPAEPHNDFMSNLSFLEYIAEQRIQEAMQRGEFDNLQGKGRPIEYEDDSFVPPDLRMAYKILKNAGYLPPELETAREIRTTLEMLEHLPQEEERYRQIKKLNLLITKMNLMRSRPIALETDQVYYRKIVERIKVRRNASQGNP